MGVKATLKRLLFTSHKWGWTRLHRRPFDDSSLTLDPRVANYFRSAGRPKIGHFLVSRLRLQLLQGLEKLLHRLTQRCLVGGVHMHRVASTRVFTFPEPCRHSNLISDADLLWSLILASILPKSFPDPQRISAQIQHAVNPNQLLLAVIAIKNGKRKSLRQSPMKTEN